MRWNLKEFNYQNFIFFLNSERIELIDNQIELCEYFIKHVVRMVSNLSYFLYNIRHILLITPTLTRAGSDTDQATHRWLAGPDTDTKVWHLAFGLRFCYWLMNFECLMWIFSYFLHILIMT